MKRNAGTPSIQDVARLAGVSQAAVSRAFTPGASIAAATKAKVEAAAAQLEYRPNLIARSLITGRSNLIGVVIGNPLNPIYGYSLDALSSRMSQVGRQLLVLTGRSGVPADALVEEMRKFRVDAIVIMSASLSPDIARSIRADGVPIVFMHRHPRMDGFASVTGANYAGAGEIADHLLAQGYRHLAYLTGLEESSTSVEREEGFVSRLAALGMAPPERAVGAFSRKGAIEGTRRLLDRSPRPDAIFCANDYMAFAAIETARHEFGLQIGPEIGIAGFDDMEGAAWASFDLTSYSQPLAELTTLLVTLLEGLLRGDAPTKVVLTGKLIARGSTQR